MELRSVTGMSTKLISLLCGVAVILSLSGYSGDAPSSEPSQESAFRGLTLTPIISNRAREMAAIATAKIRYEVALENYRATLTEIGAIEREMAKRKQIDLPALEGLRRLAHEMQENLPGLAEDIARCEKKQAK